MTDVCVCVCDLFSIQSPKGRPVGHSDSGRGSSGRRELSKVLMPLPGLRCRGGTAGRKAVLSTFLRNCRFSSVAEAICIPTHSALDRAPPRPGQLLLSLICLVSHCGVDLRFPAQ